MKILLVTAGATLFSLLQYVNAQNTFPASGNVGIGTPTPANRLTVKGDGISTSSESTSGLVKVGFYINNIGGYVQTHTNHPLFFTTNNGSTQAALLTNGNFGIGTATPAEKLVIQSGSNVLGFSHTDGTVKLGSQLNNTGTYTGAVFGTVSNHPLFFRTNNSSTPQVTLLQNGRVGIGTATPQKLLDVQGDMRIKGMDFGSNIGNNIYLGYGTANNTGSDNLALGDAVLSSTTTGFRNIGIGTNALAGVTTETDNVAIGFWTLQGSGAGGNTALGSLISLNGNFANSAYIGYNVIGTASNQVRLGNNTVTSIGGFAGWTNISDGRVKRNITANVPGLSFINKLTPVTYNLSVDAIDKITGRDQLYKGLRNSEEGAKRIAEAKAEKEKIVYTGFIAQDVERAAKSVGYDFSGVDAAKNEKDLYGLRYAEFVVPLVKSVQELSKMNEEKDAQIKNLQQQIDELKEMIKGNKTAATQNIQLTTAVLEQNVPNPFNDATVIAYSLPGKYHHAVMVVSDKSGRILKEITLTGKGKGTVNINSSSLNSGMYQYSLYVDDMLVQTKQMMLVK